MGIIQIIIIFLFNFTLILNQNTDDSCSNSEQSPVNIITSEIREISVPTLKIIRSYYPSFGNIKLNLTDMSLEPDKWENAKLYIDYYNKTVIYKPYKIYVRIFSEHSFENLKYDIELQICHNESIENDYENDADVPETLCISIFFDSGRNKKSKIFDQFYKEREYEEDLKNKYILKNIENIDLNLYINFNEPYYFYMGSGTSLDNKEFDCSLQVYWILMKKVNYMSEEELRNLRLAIYQKNKFTIKKSKKVKNEGNLIYYFENKKEKSD